jgi:hypothetical protein
LRGRVVRKQFVGVIARRQELYGELGDVRVDSVAWGGAGESLDSGLCCFLRSPRGLWWSISAGL